MAWYHMGTVSTAMTTLVVLPWPSLTVTVNVSMSAWLSAFGV